VVKTDGLKSTQKMSLSNLVYILLELWWSSNSYKFGTTSGGNSSSE